LRQGKLAGTWIVGAAALVGSLALSASAQAAVTLPQSSGASGACALGGTIDTDTGTFVGTGTVIPGAHVVTQPGSLPNVLVLECTTVTVGATTLVGSNALEIRATGAVAINGVLDLSAWATSLGSERPGPGGSFGGINGTFGGGPSGGGPGFDGSIDDFGAGGNGGPASGPHPGGAPGDPGATPSTLGFGGGGGGAGQGAFAEVPRGVPAHQSAAIRGGSGGGSGGNSRPAFNSTGGQGGSGGGAIRIITPESILVGGGGAIRADARAGLPATGASGDGGGGGGGGAGGTIQLIAPSIELGAGSTLSARGAIGGTGDGAGAADGGAGRNGRIRLITNSLNDQAAATPDIERAEAYSVAVEAGSSGTGTGTITSSPTGISCPPDCAEPVDPDATVALTATSDAGSTFEGWAGACAAAGTATTCPLVTDDSEPDLLHSVSAAFRPVPADGDGGGGGNGDGGGGGLGPDPGPDPDTDPDPDPVGARPDLAVRGPGGRLIGDGFYAPAGAQRSVAKLAPGERASFDVGIQNDGDGAGSFELDLAPERGGFKLGYRFENRRVEPAEQVAVEDLGPGEERTLVVNARATTSVRPGTARRFAIRGVVQGDGSPSDAVAIGLRTPR
jgi:hypothetical protein